MTDYIEAEGSMMFDINTMKWSNELCGILEIDTKGALNVKKIIAKSNKANYAEN